MKSYDSKSSISVKLITIGIVIAMGLVLFIIFTLKATYSTISGILISLIILSTLIYFFANSLNKIVIEEKKLTLKKNIGKIEIPVSDIIKMEKLPFSNLSMTYGSNGIFGYIGNTMDDSISIVKNKKNMVKIITKDKKYIISCYRPKELINEIENVLKQIK
jgi:hypothetical protein